MESLVIFFVFFNPPAFYWRRTFSLTLDGRDKWQSKSMLLLVNYAVVAYFHFIIKLGCYTIQQLIQIPDKYILLCELGHGNISL
jgi:hypothetical protein